MCLFWAVLFTMTLLALNNTTMQKCETMGQIKLLVPVTFRHWQVQNTEMNFTD